MSKIFLDTTIQIARSVHEPDVKEKIENRLRQYSIKTTSLVVKQEYKRRLISEAVYLLNLIFRKKSLNKVRWHIETTLAASLDKNKVRINTLFLHTIQDRLQELFPNSNDASLTDHAKSQLRNFIRFGWDELNAAVDELIWESGCACAHIRIQEIEEYEQYEIGPNKCTDVQGGCPVNQFLNARRPELEKIALHLNTLEDKTDELRKAELFIASFLEDPSIGMRQNPCHTLGDLMIALESAGVPEFYTQNYKESQHLCASLGQILIQCPHRGDQEEKINPPSVSP